jgi:hypothetical protein
MDRFRFAAAIVVLAVASAGSGQARQAKGHEVTPSCDKACLEAMADRYMDALVAHDPGRVPWASSVRFSENNVLLRVGDGLWNTITAKGPQVLKFSDPLSGQAGWYGTIEQAGTASFYAMRIKVVDGKVAEVESNISPAPRPGGGGGLGGDPKTFQHYPEMGQPLAPDERVPRNRLVDIANGYFATLQLNDGHILTAFDEDCRRLEDGIETAGSKSPNPVFKTAQMACEAQFKTGAFHADTAVRDRAYEVVDEEKGLVLARGFIDHNGAAVSFKLADGTASQTRAAVPSTLSLMELFKIRNGRIWRVEVVHNNVPYAMPSVWRDEGDGSAVTSPPHRSGSRPAGPAPARR